jgi:hypothetical protein
VIASYTGKRVAACPPDAKEYGTYPKGVRVKTFSKDTDRGNDIVAALDWIEREFDNPNWDADNETARNMHKDKRAALDKLRDKIEKDGITF